MMSLHVRFTEQIDHFCLTGVNDKTADLRGAVLPESPPI